MTGKIAAIFGIAAITTMTAYVATSAARGSIPAAGEGLTLFILVGVAMSSVAALVVGAIIRFGAKVNSRKPETVTE